jgi:methyl-accepting chemotaxis protein
MVRNLSIGAKLTGAFILMVLLTCGLGLFGVSEMGEVRTRSNEIASTWLPSIEILSDALHAFERFRVARATHLVDVEARAMADQENIMRTSRERLYRSLEKYTGMMQTDEERRLYDKATQYLEQYFATNEKIIDARRPETRGDPDMARHRRCLPPL